MANDDGEESWRYNPVVRNILVDAGGEDRVAVETDERQHTVDPREPRSFEDEIIQELTNPIGETGATGAAVPLKGKWIHGWLQQDGPDYINSIFKNWLFFIKYLEERSRRIGTTSVHQRAVGTYNSMYRYILLLEDLELVKRVYREGVSLDEYDHFVPEEFRMRTFVDITTPYSEAPGAWDSPFATQYPSTQKEGTETYDDIKSSSGEKSIPVKSGEVEEVPDEEDEEPQGTSIEVGGIDDLDEDNELERANGGQETDSSNQNAGTIDDLAGGETVTQIDAPPSGLVGIDSFPSLDQLELFIEEEFNAAIVRVIDDAPIPTANIDLEEFSIGRVGVYGEWAEEEANAGQTGLGIFVAVEATAADMKPGFIPAGLGNHLEILLEEHNQFSEWFPRYEVQSAYNSAFKDSISQVVRRSQSTPRYFKLSTGNYNKIQ